MLKLIITNFLIFAVLLSFGTTQISKTKNIIWKESINISSEFEDPLYILNFEGAGIEKVNNEFLPCFADFVEGNFSDNSIVTLKKFTSEKLTFDELKLIKSDKINVSKFETVSKVLTEKKQRKLWFKIIPFIKNGKGEIEKLTSFEIDVVQGQMQRTVSTSLNFASNSVLATGTWYRIGVPSDGMYKLDYKFLSDIGIDMATLNPQYIRLYGNGGKQLPFSNSVARFDDLTENSIVVQGENDGIFDVEDFVVFYGQTPNEWKAGDNCSKVSHRRHFYSDTTYYFLNTDIGSGLRIPSQNQSSNEANITVTSFDEYQFYENEAVNLISSGRQWLGEKFDAQTSYNFDFNFPNISISDSVYINTKGLVRSSPPSTFKVSCQGASSSFSPISVNLGNYTSDYGKFDSTCFKFIPNSSTISVKVDFTKNPQYSSAVGYLDYIEVVARRNLKLTTNYIKFKDKKSVGPGNTATFNVLDATANTRILDITNPLLPMFQTGDFSGNTFSFKQETSLLREYVAFNMVSSTLKVPTYFGKVINQNLHALSTTDLIIVSHPLFYSEALRLKNLHTSTDGLKTVLVTPQEIYNEFSSGSQDITAIKTFCKMFYDRATSSADAPKYLLLFGDASYNNRERSKNGNTNFIPSYQSLQSMDLTLSYISDDYFGLLDNNESEELQELMDVGIGRLPAKSLEEAKIMVNKIIEYETKTPLELNTNTNFCAETGANISGDWKNVICFVGDDQDRNTHLRDADKIATFVDTSYNNFNIEKIYFDTYKQVVNAGGQRFPDVKQAINSRVERGALIINYTGHGGESGWAQERVLEISDIKSWKNKGRYPFFVTATCEFARFDDPLRTSGGEDVILQEDGGGIGLLTTTRLVYSAPNFTLNKEFFNEVFVEDPDGRNIRMGEVSRLTKNQSVSQFTNNHRNFTLLGDPAMRLNFAKEKVVTTSVEVVPSASSNDTLKALSKVKITGFIANKNNIKLSNFNGLIYPIVFDKASSVRTIVNDSTGGDISLPTNVLIQKNIVFKGKISVTNGDFSFTFVVPKDIAFNYGKGRISYYGLDNATDANGFYENFIIGGTNSNAPLDEKGPDLVLFLNDEKFVPGSITDENPKLVSKVNDENGINTVGSGIGHDIVAVLDGNTNKPVILNDYYQSDLNSYTTGIIRYGFKDLSEGSHNLSLKVWDVYNNSSTATTDFVVSKSAKIALNHVMNYPNPFTTRTKFMFEHNRPCEPLEVQIQIFTVSGKIVKSIESVLQCEGYRSDKIEWDGLDDYGDKIGKGVYVYKLKVSSKDGGFAEKFEKLVLLN
jgi:hypothetical protein